MRTVLRLGATSAIATLALCIAVALVAAPAVAQVKPAMVRSVDEPARVPYGATMLFTCFATNSCTATFPVVSMGKRVHLTSLSLAMQAEGPATHFLFLHRSVPGLSPVLTMFPVVPVVAAYYGYMLATNQALDLNFEAGETPDVEIGVSAGTTIYAPGGVVTLTGYVVDLAP